MVNEILKPINERFVQFRKDNAITQEDLVSAGKRYGLNFTLGDVSMIEVGKRDLSLDLVIVMKEEFGLDYKWLLGGPDKSEIKLTAIVISIFEKFYPVKSRLTADLSHHSQPVNSKIIQLKNAF